MEDHQHLATILAQDIATAMRGIVTTIKENNIEDALKILEGAEQEMFSLRWMLEKLEKYKGHQSPS